MVPTALQPGSKSMERQAILDALRAFARQRPGLKFGNYGDATSYRAELRSITRDLSDAATLLRAVEHSEITADDILRAADGGRLSITVDGERVRIDYCTGQYWPVEYRKAVCRVLAGALWEHVRDSMTGDDIGDRIRAHFRREFGRGFASRHFN
jgi:hypothetical protein